MRPFNMASEGTADWFRRAASELARTSEVQVGWAGAIASDEALLALIDELPRERRQPSLLFAAMHLLDAPTGEWGDTRSWLVAEWPRVAAVARERRMQTNEVGRCIPLLVALARISGPIALVELGASAGLCLGVDRYAYRFDDGPVLGGGEPLLAATTTGEGVPPTSLPDIVWRAGVDLAPLDLTDPEDSAWLEALLPPDRPDRLARLRAASARLADDPPHLETGDALEALPGLLAAAPEGATLVVAALGTLVYLPAADRVEVVRVVAEAGAHLVTFEPVTVLPQVQERLTAFTAPEPTPFALALDGEPLAYGSAHGERLSWLTPVRQPDAGPGPA